MAPTSASAGRECPRHHRKFVGQRCTGRYTNIRHRSVMDVVTTTTQLLCNSSLPRVRGGGLRAGCLELQCWDSLSQCIRSGIRWDVSELCFHDIFGDTSPIGRRNLVVVFSAPNPPTVGVLGRPLSASGIVSSGKSSRRRRESVEEKKMMWRKEAAGKRERRPGGDRGQAQPHALRRLLSVLLRVGSESCGMSLSPWPCCTPRLPCFRSIRLCQPRLFAS